MSTLYNVKGLEPIYNPISAKLIDEISSRLIPSSIAINTLKQGVTGIVTINSNNEVLYVQYTGIWRFLNVFNLVTTHARLVFEGYLQTSVAAQRLSKRAKENAIQFGVSLTDSKNSDSAKALKNFTINNYDGDSMESYGQAEQPVLIDQFAKIALSINIFLRTIVDLIVVRFGLFHDFMFFDMLVRSIYANTAIPSSLWQEAFIYDANFPYLEYYSSRIAPIVGMSKIGWINGLRTPYLDDVGNERYGHVNWQLEGVFWTNDNVRDYVSFSEYVANFTNSQGIYYVIHAFDHLDIPHVHTFVSIDRLERYLIKSLRRAILEGALLHDHSKQFVRRGFYSCLVINCPQSLFVYCVMLAFPTCSYFSSLTRITDRALKSMVSQFYDDNRAMVNELYSMKLNKILIWDKYYEYVRRERKEEFNDRGRFHLLKLPDVLLSEAPYTHTTHVDKPIRWEDFPLETDDSGDVYLFQGLGISKTMLTKNFINMSINQVLTSKVLTVSDVEMEFTKDIEYLYSTYKNYYYSIRESLKTELRHFLTKDLRSKLLRMQEEGTLNSVTEYYLFWLVPLFFYAKVSPSLNEEGQLIGIEGGVPDLSESKPRSINNSTIKLYSLLLRVLNTSFTTFSDMYTSNQNIIVWGAITEPLIGALSSMNPSWTVKGYGDYAYSENVRANLFSASHHYTATIIISDADVGQYSSYLDYAQAVVEYLEILYSLSYKHLLFKIQCVLPPVIDVIRDFLISKKYSGSVSLLRSHVQNPYSLEFYLWLDVSMPSDLGSFSGASYSIELHSYSVAAFSVMLYADLDYTIYDGTIPDEPLFPGVVGLQAMLPNAQFALGRMLRVCSSVQTYVADDSDVVLLYGILDFGRYSLMSRRPDYNLILGGLSKYIHANDYGGGKIDNPFRRISPSIGGSYNLIVKVMLKRVLSAYDLMSVAQAYDVGGRAAELSLLIIPPIQYYLIDPTTPKMFESSFGLNVINALVQDVNESVFLPNSIVFALFSFTMSLKTPEEIIAELTDLIGKLKSDTIFVFNYYSLQGSKIFDSWDYSEGVTLSNLGERGTFGNYDGATLLDDDLVTAVISEYSPSVITPITLDGYYSSLAHFSTVPIGLLNNLITYSSFCPTVLIRTSGA